MLSVNIFLKNHKEPINFICDNDKKSRYVISNLLNQQTNWIKLNLSNQSIIINIKSIILVNAIELEKINIYKDVKIFFNDSTKPINLKIPDNINISDSLEKSKMFKYEDNSFILYFNLDNIIAIESNETINIAKDLSEPAKEKPNKSIDFNDIDFKIAKDEEIKEENKEEIKNESD